MQWNLHLQLEYFLDAKRGHFTTVAEYEHDAETQDFASHYLEHHLDAIKTGEQLETSPPVGITVKISKSSQNPEGTF